MQLYMVVGEDRSLGEDECTTYIYGIFNDRKLAEKHRNKLEETLEENGSDELIYIQEYELNKPTQEYYDTLEG